MLKRILIAGYYGFGNVGDEAILSVLLSNLRELPYELEIKVVSGNPVETQATYGVNSLRFNDLFGILKAIEYSDLVILGGGGLFHDYQELDWTTFLSQAAPIGVLTYTSFPILARLYGKPCIIFSVGVGPLFFQESQNLTKVAFENASLATLRDQESFDELKSLGVENPDIKVTADPVFCLRSDEEETARILSEFGLDENGKEPVLAVNLRNWDINVPLDAWQRETATALDMFLGNHGGTVIFIPFQVGEQSIINDILAAQNIITYMKHPERTRMLINEDGTPLKPEHIAGVVGACDLVVGMRLHSIIFSALANRPFVSLGYDPKVAYLVGRLDLNELLLPLANLTSIELFNKMEYAWKNQEDIKGHLKKKNSQMLPLAFQNFVEIKNLLEAPPPARTTFKGEEFLIDLALRQIQNSALLEQSKSELQDELVKKEQELVEIHANPVWNFSKWLGDIIAPSGSTRERLLRKIARFFEVLRTDGLRGVFAKVVRRLLPKLESRKIDEINRSAPAMIEAIIEKHPDVKDIVVFLPSVEWDLPLFQRPQQMALAFARQGCLVFYCSYDVSQIGIHKLDERLYLCNVLLESFSVIESPITITLTYNNLYLKHFRQPRVVYEYIDDLEVFPHDLAELKKNHRELCEKADVVLATAKKLLEEVRPLRDDVILCPNGVEYEHFEPAREVSSPPPEDMAKIINLGKPIVGYYGALARWFDYNLLYRAARTRDDISFVLIGHDFDGTLAASGLLRLPNVHWLGIRPYAELPKYLAYFDVATIPFRLNRITHATSPVKLFEYMAGHKPIVTTAMHESKRYEGVLSANTIEEYLEKIDEAMDLRNNAEYIALIDGVARRNTWDERARQILETMRKNTRTDR